MKEFVSRLTWVDYLTLIAILRGCYVGYRFGFFPELLRIAAYLVTAIVTLRFHETLAQLLTLKTFMNDATAGIVSFLLILIVVLSVTKLVTVIFLRLLKLGEGSFTYRLIGMALGACRWVILLSFVFMLIDTSPLTPLKTDIHQRSVVGQKVSALAPMLFDFLSAISPQLGVPAKVS